MSLKTESYKGVKDYYPQDFALRENIFRVWREACERFGYLQYDASVLEPLALYAAKSSQELVEEESFSFLDRKDRLVTLRPEMTPTVSRMVAAKRQEFGYPLRLFSIPNCFRYERMQRGRSREFYQLNADIFGDDTLNADVEAIMLADYILKQFGATDDMYTIRVNSRQLLIELIEAAGGAANQQKIIKLIDKFAKMSQEEFTQQLAGLCEKPQIIFDLLSGETPKEQQESSSYKKVMSVLESLEHLEVKAQFAPSLARGLDYYVDIVFEVFDNHPDNNRSMFGGGRYDGLVGLFGVEDLPTVGFGMGDATLYNFLEVNDLLPEAQLSLQLVVLPIDLNLVQIDKLCRELRRKGVNLSVDYSDKKLDKRIKQADKIGGKFVLFVGEQELSADQYKLKNLTTQQEQVLSVDQIVEAVQAIN